MKITGSRYFTAAHALACGTAVVFFGAVGCTERNNAAAPAKERTQVTALEVSAAVDAYLVAYRDSIADVAPHVDKGSSHHAGEEGTSGPTSAQWAEANAISMRLGEKWDEHIRVVVHDSLDVLFGFDFRHPASTIARQVGVSGKGLRESGNFRIMTNRARAVELIDAARQAYRDSIENGGGPVADAFKRNFSARGESASALPFTFDGPPPADPMVAHAIGTFWISYPTYAPNHSGRCFPHGHEYMEGDYNSPKDCQVEYISQYAAHLALLVHNQNDVHVPEEETQATGNFVAACECYAGFDDGCPGALTTCSQFSSCSGGGGSADGECRFLGVF